jgi:hypothetical protein
MQLPSFGTRLYIRIIRGKGVILQCDGGLKPPPEQLFVSAAIYRIGLGWDTDLPLRPWPACHMDLLTKAPKVHERAVRQDFCIAFFGLYFGYTVYWDLAQIEDAP